MVAEIVIDIVGWLINAQLLNQAANIYMVFSSGNYKKGVALDENSIPKVLKLWAIDGQARLWMQPAKHECRAGCLIML
jgi:hypothetical protein